MNQTKEKCPGAAATVQSTSNSTHSNNNISGGECKGIKDMAWECYKEIDPMVYLTERLISNFERQYFDLSWEAFKRDVDAQQDFIREYEYMAAQLWAISALVRDIRVKCEFVGGDENEPIIAAHIKQENQMRNWLSPKMP